MHPFLHVDDLEGAVWVPEDAVADPVAICTVLATVAKQGGVHYVENCQIEQVFTENGAVKKVKTSKGFIECQYFVNCAGMVSIIKIDIESVENMYSSTKIHIFFSGLEN